MFAKILVSSLLRNPDFDSADRREGLQRLGAHGDVRFYDGELTAADAEGVMGAIANMGPIDDGFYTHARDLRILARWGVGFDNVNVELATELGIVITISPEHMSSVAEYTIAQWLATLKRVFTLNERAHRGDSSITTTYDAMGSTLGLYGFGRIGQETAARARPLLGETGRLLVYDIRPDIKELAERFGGEAVSDPLALFRESDTVSLHVAGSDPIVGDQELQAMKPHASLINPSRGNLVDDAAVSRAISADRIYYYVVDEPANKTREIHRGNPRVICTNHNAGSTVDAAMRLDQRTFQQVTDALAGRRPQHILNPDVLHHERVKAWLA